MSRWNALQCLKPHPNGPGKVIPHTRFQDVELTFWTPPLTPCILGDSFTANPLTADHRESDFSEQASRGTAVMSVKPFNAEQVAVEVPIAAAAAPARNTMGAKELQRKGDAKQRLADLGIYL